MSLPEALENAAEALVEVADPIRDANGDPVRLLETLGDAHAPGLIRWLLEHEADAAAELADEWSELEGGAELLAALSEDGLAKPGRKVLRRLRHRLRSSGVALEEAPKPERVVARLPEVADDLGRAFVLPLDPRGARAVYMVEPHPGGGARLVEGLLDEVRGVVDFSVYNAGRSRVRSFMREIARHPTLPAAAVTLEDAKTLIATTAARQPEGRPLPKAYGEFRTKLGLDAAGGRRPGDLAREALRDAEGDRDALAAAAALVKEQKVGPWPPAVERAREIAEAYREKAGGKIIVSGAMEAGREAEATSEAAVDLFDEGFAAATARRFAEAAYVFWRGDKLAEARACAAAAAAFEAGPQGENPVALALVETLVGPLIEQLEREAGETPAAGAEGKGGSEQSSEAP